LKKTEIFVAVGNLQKQRACRILRRCKLSDVGDRRRHERRQKVVVLKELHRAIIYTTEMSKQVTRSYVSDAVHVYPVN
jgi:nicotinic acid phosphoribosyltransferase